DQQVYLKRGGRVTTHRRVALSGAAGRWNGLIDEVRAIQREAIGAYRRAHGEFLYQVLPHDLRSAGTGRRLGRIRPWTASLKYGGAGNDRDRRRQATLPHLSPPEIRL